MRLSLLLFMALNVYAQGSELGLTLGRLLPRHRGELDLQGGMALQVNYGKRVWSGRGVALLGEGHLLASPLREVATANPRAARDFASLYLMPGLRMQFGAVRRLRPYVAGGMGYVQYHSSELLQSGAASPVRDRQHTWGGNFGGGVDVQVLRWLALRGEVRDFVTPTPRFNTPLTGAQHNVQVSGGIVLRFTR
jgi:opacity protein-like surface antigen